MTASLDVFETFWEFSRNSNIKNFTNSIKYFMEKIKYYGQDDFEGIFELLPSVQNGLPMHLQSGVLGFATFTGWSIVAKGVDWPYFSTFRASFYSRTSRLHSK